MCLRGEMFLRGEGGRDKGEIGGREVEFRDNSVESRFLIGISACAVDQKICQIFAKGSGKN